MSWLFGKKKHHESPPEETPPDDSFIFVEQRRPVEPSPDNLPSNLYPSLSNFDNLTITGAPTPYPITPGQTLEKQNSQDSHSNYIASIPFKFCRELERSMNEDLVIDKLRLSDINSFIKRINIQEYDYSFSLERSVISEFNSQH